MTGNEAPSTEEDYEFELEVERVLQKKHENFEKKQSYKIKTQQELFDWYAGQALLGVLSNEHLTRSCLERIDSKGLMLEAPIYAWAMAQVMMDMRNERLISQYNVHLDD